MLRSSRIAVWFLSATTLAMGAGCQSSAKNPTAANSILKPKAATANASNSNPGSPDFSISNKLKDPVKVRLAYALWHEQEGNLVEARNAYDKVLSDNPKTVEALLGLARLDIAVSRMDDAEKRLQKAQKLAPRNPQVAISYGQFYSARNEWTRALEQMKVARSLAPYDPAAAYHLGYVQAKCGDMTSALASFTEAVGAAEAEYNLAYILNEQGNLVAAEEHLERAISLKPDLSRAQSLLVTVRQQRQGNSQLTKRQSAAPSTYAPSSPVQQANSVQQASSVQQTSPIQQASHTELAPAQPSNFAPAASK